MPIEDDKIKAVLFCHRATGDQGGCTDTAYPGHRAVGRREWLQGFSPGYEGESWGRGMPHLIPDQGSPGLPLKLPLGGPIPQDTQSLVPRDCPVYREL